MVDPYWIISHGNEQSLPSYTHTHTHILSPTHIQYIQYVLADYSFHDVSTHIHMCGLSVCILQYNCVSFIHSNVIIPFPANCSFTAGCDNETCFSDTWALDTSTDTWSLLVNSSAQLTPRGRATTAGGVYPGESDLWLSMGENKASFRRKFSDTWVLHVNTSGAQLFGEGSNTSVWYFNQLPAIAYFMRY